MPSFNKCQWSHTEFCHVDGYALWKFLTKDKNQGCCHGEIKSNHKEMLM